MTKDFKELLPSRWWQKSTGIDMEQNYITVSLRTSCTEEIRPNKPNTAKDIQEEHRLYKTKQTHKN